MRSYWFHIALVHGRGGLCLVLGGLGYKRVQVLEVDFCADEVVDLRRLVLNGLHLGLHLLLSWQRSTRLFKTTSSFCCLLRHVCLD